MLLGVLFQHSVKSFKVLWTLQQLFDLFYCELSRLDGLQYRSVNTVPCTGYGKKIPRLTSSGILCDSSIPLEDPISR